MNINLIINVKHVNMDILKQKMKNEFIADQNNMEVLLVMNADMKKIYLVMILIILYAMIVKILIIIIEIIMQFYLLKGNAIIANMNYQNHARNVNLLIQKKKTN